MIDGRRTPTALLDRALAHYGVTDPAAFAELAALFMVMAFVIGLIILSAQPGMAQQLEQLFRNLPDVFFSVDLTEGRLIQKMVILPVDLSRARLTRGV